MKAANSQTTFVPEKNPLASALYVVATPIGNLGDITLRALTTLASVDVIACEDTRVTGKLARRFGIMTKLEAYHDHNAARQRPRIMALLASGKSVALVSDAGTPLISDPGYKLVREVVAEGFKVVAVPGPSSLTAALAVAGLPSDRFLFEGFLPSKETQAKKALQALAGVPATLVFFESAKRVAATLALMHETLGARDAAVARELTKLYEETRRGTLAELAAHYAKAAEPKGEIVIVVGPPLAREISAGDIEDALNNALAELSLKDAVAKVEKELGAPHREVYSLALALKGKK